MVFKKSSGKNESRDLLRVANLKAVFEFSLSMESKVREILSAQGPHYDMVISFKMKALCLQGFSIRYCMQSLREMS